MLLLTVFAVKRGVGGWTMYAPLQSLPLRVGGGG